MADIATSAYRRRSLGLSLPLIFALAVYLPLLFGARAVLGDPDTYWHIALGRWIIAHREVPRFDVFSFSMPGAPFAPPERSEEHTSELQSQSNLVCRLLLEKK